MSSILFRIADHSGGINRYCDPLHVPLGEFVEVYNMETIGRAKIRRNGYDEHNPDDTDTITIQALASFVNTAGNWHLLAQCDDGGIYVNTNRPPDATGSFTATAVITQTAGFFRMFVVEWKGQIIITNGVDRPWIWGGNYPYVTGFKRGIGSNYTDYYDEVTDGSSLTYAAPGSLIPGTYTGQSGIDTTNTGFTQGSDQVPVTLPCYGAGVATSGGTYSGSDTNPVFRVQITTAGALATAKFKYKKDTGAGFGALLGSEVTTAAATVAATIADGMTIKFDTTGANTNLTETNFAATGDGTKVLITGFPITEFTKDDILRFEDGTRVWLHKVLCDPDAANTFQEGGAAVTFDDAIQDGYRELAAGAEIEEIWQEGGSGVDYTDVVNDCYVGTSGPSNTTELITNYAPAASSIIRFPITDYIPAGSTIVLATLSFYAYVNNYDPGDSITISARDYYGKDWTESNMPTGGECDTSGTDYNASAEDTQAIAAGTYTNYEMTVTNIIQNQLDGSNYGIFIRHDSYVGSHYVVKIASSEYATVASRPKLTVSYIISGAWTNSTVLIAGEEALVDGGSKIRSVIQFPAPTYIPLGVTVSAATLTLVKSAHTGTGNVLVHGMKNTLTSEITGLAATSIDTSGTDYEAVADDTKDITGATFVFDVATCVQNMFNSPATNYGFLLIGPEAGDGNFITFHSAEATTAANRPKLTITLSDYAVHVDVGALNQGTLGDYALNGLVDVAFTQSGGALPAGSEIYLTTCLQVNDFFDIYITTDQKRLYGAYPRCPAGLRFTIPTGYGNVLTSVCTPYYWNGIAWAACASFVDGTATSGASFAKTGNMTWTKPTGSVERMVGGVPGHWIKLEWDSGTTSTLRIESVQAIDVAEVLPDTWNGVLALASKAYTLVGTAYTAQANLISYSGEVAMDSFATTSRIYVGYGQKLKGLYLTTGTAVNATASVMTAKFWNGEAWQSFTTTSDGTAVTGASLGQSGYVFWGVNPEEEETRRISDDTADRYWYELSFSVQLDADCDLAIVEVVPAGSAPKAAKCCEKFANRVWLGNFIEDKGKFRMSAEYNGQMWSGTDSTYESTIGHAAIIAIRELDKYLVLYKSDGIEFINGSSLSDFVKYGLVTNGVGLTAPQSLVAAGKIHYFFHATGFYMLRPGDQDLLIDVIKISEDKEIKSGIGGGVDADDLVKQLDPDYYSNMVGVYYPPKDQVWWFLTRYTGQTTNNFVYVYEIKTNSWVLWDIPMASGTVIVGSDGYFYLMGGGINDWKIYRMDYGSDDNGGTIYSHLTYPKATADNPDMYKLLHYIKAQLEIQSSGTVDVGVYVDESTDLKSKTPALSLTDVNRQTAFISESGFSFQLVLSSDDLWSIRGLAGYGYPVNEY